jgi:hypothetical protein
MTIDLDLIHFHTLAKMTAKLTAHLYIRPFGYFGDDDDMAWIPRVWNRDSVPNIKRITPEDFMSPDESSTWDGSKAGLKENFPHYIDYCRTLRKVRKYLLRRLCSSEVLREVVKPFADLIVWSALRGFEQPQHSLLRGSIS